MDHAAASLGHFQQLFSQQDDPWGYRTRWYEIRKRRLMLAALPQQRYAHAYEPGCANGETTVELAQRCDAVLASDAVPAALVLAQERVRGLSNVQVVQAMTPQQWPPGAFDLVVLGEFVYYLDRTRVGILIERVRASLAASRTVLACHWRHPLDDAQLSAQEVHATLDAQLGLRKACAIADRDFLLDVWCE
jgi:SAM-dependent methyltransferase